MAHTPAPHISHSSTWDLPHFASSIPQNNLSDCNKLWNSNNARDVCHIPHLRTRVHGCPRTTHEYITHCLSTQFTIYQMTLLLYMLWLWRLFGRLLNASLHFAPIAFTAKDFHSYIININELKPNS